MKTHKPVVEIGGPSGPIGASGAPFVGSSMVEPSWFRKLRHKIKKSLCFRIDRMYEYHVYEKKEAQRHKAMLRHMNLPVSVGSENSITPKEKWIAEHGKWSDEEIAVEDPQRTPVHRSTRGA